MVDAMGWRCGRVPRLRCLSAVSDRIEPDGDRRPLVRRCGVVSAGRPDRREPDRIGLVDAKFARRPLRMTRPGDRLRTLAANWCCPETMARVIDPLIADLQREHAEARRSGRIWKSRWIQIAGWLAFLKVMVICGATSLTSLEEWTPDDRKSLTRAAVISVGTAVVITALLVSRSAEDYPKVLLHPSPTRFLLLAPYPFVAGVVLGATLGVALGLGGRALSRRLVAAAIVVALICSGIVFIDVGWVAPAANIAYRMTIGESDPP